VYNIPAVVEIGLQETNSARDVKRNSCCPLSK